MTLLDILAKCETLEENILSFEVTDWTGPCANIIFNAKPRLSTSV